MLKPGEVEELSGEDLLAGCGGEVIAGTLPDRVAGVSTDSRSLAPGAAFVALKGERFDGHDFTADVLARGAAAAVVSHAPGPGCTGGGCIIRVDDTLRALAGIAARHRSKFLLPVVAVSGSNGKTTTKDMLTSILAGRMEVLSTEGSLNNEIGVPLVLLKLASFHEAAVIEMGMNAPGELAALAAAARPDRAIITNVGRAHLEGLGTVEGVAKAKAELAEAVAGAGGVLILNADDERLARLAQEVSCRVVTFGLEGGADFMAGEICPGEGGTSFLVNGRGRISLQMPGSHNVMNALAAIAAASTLETDFEACARGLEGLRLPASRTEIRRLGGVTVINDSYNANPDSMAAALAVLSGMDCCRRLAVLGTMKELGDSAKTAHHELGSAVAACNLDMLVMVGEWGDAVCGGAREAGMPPGRIRTCATKEEAAAFLKEELEPGDAVLLKGSRAARMEDILELLSSGPAKAG